MERKKEKVKLPILVPLALAILVLLFASIISIYSLQKRNINDGVQRRISGVHKMFQARMEQDSQLLNGLLDYLKRDETLQNASLIDPGWAARLKPARAHLVTPGFSEVTDTKACVFVFVQGEGIPDNKINLA